MSMGKVIRDAAAGLICSHEGSSATDAPELRSAPLIMQRRSELSLQSGGVRPDRCEL